MKKKIMIIEDNKILSDMYKFKLWIEWYEVFVENESENAIKEYEKFQPDLIILDLMMPWVSGFDITHTIKKELKHSTIVLVLSNLNEEKEIQKAYELWADKFILKASLSPKELVEEIKKILE
jgi:DNA-binding response OmpR family regulator